MLLDTDVLIWALRGNAAAAALIDSTPHLELSAVSYMELLKGARDKGEQRQIKSFIRDLGFEMLPIDTNASHRAVIYMEEYVVSAGVEMADALIAATAAESAALLCTANDRHYRFIPDVELHVFRPQ